jgi:hypothetical protein
MPENTVLDRVHQIIKDAEAAYAADMRPMRGRFYKRVDGVYYGCLLTAAIQGANARSWEGETIRTVQYHYDIPYNVAYALMYGFDHETGDVYPSCWEGDVLEAYRLGKEAQERLKPIHWKALLPESNSPCSQSDKEGKARGND